MKWIGQHIVDLIARFRSSIYLEGVETGTIASGGNLGLDSDNKIVKDSGVGATDLHGAGVDGAANQLLTDDGDGTVTSESGLLWDATTLTVGPTDTTSVGIKRKDGHAVGGTLKMLGANAAGANQTGGALKFYGGQGTGTGDGGDIEFWTAADGTSGSSLNGFGVLPRLKVDADGDTTISGNLNILGTIFTTGDATVFGNDIIFEGTSDDVHEATLSGGNPGSDITVTLPASTGTLALQNEDTTGNASTADAATLAAGVASIGNLTGDVTSSNRATTIAADAVTYAKMQNVSATNVVLGRDSAGAGVVEEISATNLRTIINVEDGATADQTQADIHGLAITTVGTLDTGNATAIVTDASTSAKGKASFSSDNFAVSSGAVTIKDGGVDLTAEVTGVLPNANLDADTMHLNVAQTVTSLKTYTANMRIGGDTSTSNNWISIDCRNGSDTTGGGISFFETGSYDVDTPQYGAKIAYNEDDDTFSLGTIQNNSYLKQLYIKRNLDYIYLADACFIEGTTPGLILKDSSTTVADGDNIGVIAWQNDDDTSTTLQMRGVATENHADDANGGSKIEFYVTPNTTSAIALALTVGQDKSLTVEGAIELGDASDTTIARTAAGKVTIEGARIKTQELYIKILPSDFIADDGGRPLAIDDTTSDRWVESHGANTMFASAEIPAGFKATDVHIYGTGSPAITVYEANVDARAVTSKGTGNVGASINITDVTADATNYILIELAQASGDQVNGGIMTIAAV